MAKPPRRKWLQVHLSTAVVLMFAAGGLIWGNVKARVESFYSEMQMSLIKNGYDSYSYVGDPEKRFHYGWPYEAKMSSTMALVKEEHANGQRNRWYDPMDYWYAGAIALNVIVALAILFAVWFVCERWIHWRAKSLQRNEPGK